MAITTQMPEDLITYAVVDSSPLRQTYKGDKLILKTSSHGLIQIIDRSHSDLWIASLGEDVGIVAAKHTNIILQTTEKSPKQISMSLSSREPEFQTVTAGVFTPDKDTVTYVDVRVSPEVKFRHPEHGARLVNYQIWLKARQERTCLDIHKLIPGPVTRASTLQGHIIGYDVYYGSPRIPSNLIGQGELGWIRDECEETLDPQIIGNVVIIYYTDLIRCKASNITSPLCKIIRDLNLDSNFLSTVATGGVRVCVQKSDSEGITRALNMAYQEGGIISTSFPRPPLCAEMRLLPREQAKILLHQAGFLAQKRLARGLRLNQTEATALIATVLQEWIRDGKYRVSQLMQLGKEILGRRHVLPGVATLIEQIQVEGTFEDGVFLVTVHDPIVSHQGNLNNALYGSFLPVPPDSAFPPLDDDDDAHAAENAPGALVLLKNDIIINKGKERIKLKVTNKGDRPVQVGSHYNFIETNKDLCFDRLLSYGKRLDIPSGTAVRFEPGDCKTVTLVPISGAQIVWGGNGLVNGPVNKGAISPSSGMQFIENELSALRDDLLKKGFGYVPEPDAWRGLYEDTKVKRETYAGMFGPTVGDRVRLADTSLWVEVEKDYTVYGDEVKFGGGKTIRDGMGQASGLSNSVAMDLVITNALIVDWSGIYKADIGIKGGHIHGIGKAGNPDTMSVPPDTTFLPIGGSTEVIAGEHLIITAGAIDAHVHYICPQQVTEALASGTTTMIGGGTGPSAGTCATTCSPSTNDIQRMLEAMDGLPMNFAITGKGNDSGGVALEEVVLAGAAGLKLHEDWGSTPAVIRKCLDIGDKYDVQVNIHTDTLNEGGFVESTIAAFDGRTIHTYHTEGAGGGHAPDIIVVCGQENVLPSSTNPTRPYARNTLDEHLDMLMVCHHLDRNIPEDLAFAESRIRAETVAAEDVLHDIGALSMISSDSQAMGRVGEVVARTWRTASKMKDMRGPLTELGDTEGIDNGRVKRYIAKYTINPAITHGMAHLIGQVAPGQFADLVLWKPENFGSKPEVVIKGGLIAWAQMGDANASIPTIQPVYGLPMWGSEPLAAARTSIAFVSKISVENGTTKGYGLQKRIEPVYGCRSVKKDDMKWNDKKPNMSVDPFKYEVFADGDHMTVPVGTKVPLGRAYNLF